MQLFALTQEKIEELNEEYNRKKEENDGSYIFWYDTGHPFAEVNFSSNYVYLTFTSYKVRKI